MSEFNLQALIPSQWKGRFGPFNVSLFFYWFQQQNQTLYGSMVWEDYHQMKVAISGTMEEDNFVFYDYKILRGKAPYSLHDRKVVRLGQDKITGQDEAVGEISLVRV